MHEEFKKPRPSTTDHAKHPAPRPTGSARTSHRNRSTKELNRLRPKRIPYDKEILYDSNIELKDEIAKLGKENMRLKTRVKALEAEIAKEVIDRPGYNKSMISSLKT
jgi:hypothetical protein